MEYVSLIIGIIILIFIITDIVITTLAPHGGGFLTSYISRMIWKFLLYLNKNHGATRVLNLSGMFLIIIILAIWILFLWSGYSFIFCFDDNSVINNTTKIPATVQEKIYYVGYSLSTLGYGDFSGGNAFWKILSSSISFTGLIIISIAITYLVPINSAEISKRRISTYIST